MSEPKLSEHVRRNGCTWRSPCGTETDGRLVISAKIALLEEQLDLSQQQQFVDAMRIFSATDIAIKHAQVASKIDGERHKAWIIDQMCRVLLRDRYADWVDNVRNGEDELDARWYWDEGIAP